MFSYFDLKKFCKVSKYLAFAPMTLGIINPIGFDLFGWQGIFL